jgi:DNA-binding CsgD family transcriptional regulator
MPLSIEESIPFARKMAQYIYDNKVACVIVPGEGAQIVAYMVKTIWQNDPILSKRKMPLFFALAERGKLRTADNTKKYSPIKTRPINQTADLITQRMGKHKKSLLKEPVFILEDCYHSGKTVKNLIQALNKLGFKNVKTGSIVYDKGEIINPRIDIFGKQTSDCPTFRGSRALYLGMWRNSQKRLKKTIKEKRKEARAQLRMMRLNFSPQWNKKANEAARRKVIEDYLTHKRLTNKEIADTRRITLNTLRRTRERIRAAI